MLTNASSRFSINAGSEFVAFLDGSISAGGGEFSLLLINVSDRGTDVDGIVSINFPTVSGDLTLSVFCSKVSDRSRGVVTGVLLIDGGAGLSGSLSNVPERVTAAEKFSVLIGTSDLIGVLFVSSATEDTLLNKQLF